MYYRNSQYIASMVDRYVGSFDWYRQKSEAYDLMRTCL